MGHTYFPREDQGDASSDWPCQNPKGPLLIFPRSHPQGCIVLCFISEAAKECSGVSS